MSGYSMDTRTLYSAELNAFAPLYSAELSRRECLSMSIPIYSHQDWLNATNTTHNFFQNCSRQKPWWWDTTSGCKVNKYVPISQQVTEAASGPGFRSGDDSGHSASVAHALCDILPGHPEVRLGPLCRHGEKGGLNLRMERHGIMLCRSDRWTVSTIMAKPKTMMARHNVTL